MLKEPSTGYPELLREKGRGRVFRRTRGREQPSRKKIIIFGTSKSLT